jgi:hypothetical protein
MLSTPLTFLKEKKHLGLGLNVCGCVETFCYLNSAKSGIWKFRWCSDWSQSAGPEIRLRDGT